MERKQTCELSEQTFYQELIYGGLERADKKKRLHPKLPNAETARDSRQEHRKSLDS